MSAVLAACAPPAQEDRAVQGNAGVGQQDSVTTAAGEAGGTRLLIVGTSLTAGYGLDNPDDAYPAVLQRMADSTGAKLQVQNGGLSGETSAGALRRVSWLLRSPYDVVVIETGANDGLRGLDVDSTRANLRAIVREVRSRLPKARIVLVQMEAPPNLGADYTRRFHESFALVAREEGIGLMPFLLEGVAGEPKFNQRDGIHPNEAGARQVAANVWDGLQPFLGLGLPPGQ